MHPDDRIVCYAALGWPAAILQAHYERRVELVRKGRFNRCSLAHVSIYREPCCTFCACIVHPTNWRLLTPCSAIHHLLRRVDILPSACTSVLSGDQLPPSLKSFCKRSLDAHYLLQQVCQQPYGAPKLGHVAGGQSFCSPAVISNLMKRGRENFDCSPGSFGELALKVEKACRCERGASLWDSHYNTYG